MSEQPPKSEIIIYKARDGSTELKVKLEQETVWLSLNQLAVLFDTDKSGISRHIRNIYKEGELHREATVAKIATVQKEGKREIKRVVEFFNLDAVISIGYRVNSKRATQFRIWATSVLKDHILKGFTLNKNRVIELKGKQLTELEHAVGLVKKTIAARAITGDEARGLLDIITGYAYTWVLLQRYDEARLPELPVKKARGQFEYAYVQDAIGKLKMSLIKKREASELFGTERENGLERIIGAISQTFGGKDLYPSIEEKASHLLYFIIKDHPFSDGNKRIGSFLFIVFLAKNRYLYKKSGEQKIDNNTLVALALLIAESDPRQKELMIKLVMHFVAEV